MGRMRSKGGLIALALLTLGLAATTATAGQGKAREYVVLYGNGTSAAEGAKAVEAAGGRVLSVNKAIGLATVRSSKSDFVARAGRQDALRGAALNRAIGHAPKLQRARWQDVERVEKARDAVSGRVAAKEKPAAGGDPLSGQQWDMRMIGATPDGSYAKQRGSHDVLVGVMDTGIDASHPDLAPNFVSDLSSNFTTDDELVDGPCAEEPDRSCSDPAYVDEAGHGTHVAGIIGAALNGRGIAGVAPDVGLVNLRAGQDSGYFFLQPTVDALTYAGDNGIDVVNMSFYIDPWLYNCAANPADSPAEQDQQRTIIEATQRALAYAREHGVTLIAAEGNGHTDLGKPQVDDTSPDYPNQETSPHHRDIDNSCLSMPTEGQNVIGVTSVGPSGNKAYYSDYGLEQADVSAPGGDVYDKTKPGNPTPEDAVLSSYPESVARAEGDISKGGAPTSRFVVRDCASDGTCAYYEYLQGTSMAAPHAVGVAALAIAQYGTADAVHGGKTLAPATVETLLQDTATDTPCPAENPFSYPNRPAEFTALCEGTTDRNGFFGDGIVNAESILSATP